ncbi:Serine/threonine-protein kinase, partial [Spiromyces aspiralis]
MTLDRPLPEETFGQELRHLAASVPNADRFPIVKSLPLCECRKLTTLRRYIEDAARNIQRQTLQLINRNDGMTESDGPVTDGIQLKNVGVTLHTVFLSPNDAQKTEPVLAAARHQQMSSGDPLRPTSSRIGEFAGESSRPSFSSDVPSVMSERQRQQQQQYMSQPYVVSRDRTPSVLSVNTTDTATEATVAATVGVASRQRGTAGSRRESSYASISNVVATAVPPTSSNICSGTHEGKNHSHTCSPGNGDACHQAEVLFQLQQLNIDYASSGRASVKSDHDSGALSAEPGDAYRRRGAEKHAPASPSSGLQGSAGSAGGSNRQEMTRSTGGSYATTRGESYVTGDYGRRRSVARLLHKKANQAFPLACSDLGPSYYPAPSKLPVHQRAVGSGGSNSSRGGSGGGVLRGFGVASMAGGKGWGPEGILVANLCEHQDSVRTMAISADNVLLATGGDDGVVRVWDCQAFVKNSVHRSSAIHHQGGRIQSLAFVAQTHSLVACSDNGRIDLIAVEIEEASEMVNAPIRRGQCCLVRKYMLRQREYGVQCQYLKSDEASYLVVATNQSRVIALDVRTFEKQWEASMKFSYGRITCFVCDQHQRSWMLLGTATGRLLLLDLRFRMVVQVYTHPLSAVINQMCLYAESRASEASVLVATSNGEVGVFGVESGEWKLVLSTRGWEEIQQDLQQSHILAQTSPETSGLPPALIELVHHRTAAESGDSDAEDDQSPDPSSPQSIVDRHTVSTPSSVRAICHLPGSAYVIAGGNDTKIRSWNIQRLDKSYVISSNGYADRFSYNSYRIGNTLYHCESVPQNSTTAAATRLRGQSIGSGRNRPLSQQSVLSAATVAASYHRREGSTASAQGSEAHSLVTGPSSGSNARGRLSVNQLGDNDTEVTSMHSNDGGDQYRMASTASTPQIPMSPVKRRLVPPELDQQVGRHTDAITCMQITQYPHLMLIVGARDGVIK